jgi:hypothetical protein
MYSQFLKKNKVYEHPLWEGCYSFIAFIKGESGKTAEGRD